MLHQFLPHEHHKGQEWATCELQELSDDSLWAWLKETLHQDLGEGHLENFVEKDQTEVQSPSGLQDIDGPLTWADMLPGATIPTDWVEVFVRPNDVRLPQGYCLSQKPSRAPPIFTL